jgi:hypothetical protein
MSLFEYYLMKRELFYVLYCMSNSFDVIPDDAGPIYINPAFSAGISTTLQPLYKSSGVPHNPFNQEIERHRRLLTSAEYQSKVNVPFATHDELHHGN